MAALHDDPRRLVTALILSIPKEAAGGEATTSNPLRDLPVEARNVFLTLYALFEKELLPAFDLLDRNLITRLKVTPPSVTNTHGVETRPPLNGKATTSLYLVRSAQQSTSRNANYEHVTYYEVRLDAWSCSCPAFTFSAFPASTVQSNTSSTPAFAFAEPVGDEAQWLFGGLTRGSDMPVCKHLLACVLVEHCHIFAKFAEEKEVSVEELAGWAAGWGD